MSAEDVYSIEALQSAWKVIDSKDQGIIGFDEWHASIRQLNCDLTETDIRNVFKLIDKQSSGHINATEFIEALTNQNNQALSTILSFITGNKTAEQTQTDTPHPEDDTIQKWKHVFEETFGGMNTISQEVWIDKIMALRIDAVTEDDLRLFHAVMDSRFRSCFDFDEFYETFTTQSLHHQEMDSLRDTLAQVLLPEPVTPVTTSHTAVDTKTTKQTNEISIQTDDIHHAIHVALEHEYDVEIDTLERHIVEEEKYLEIMDAIDQQKQRNRSIFNWNNAHLWNEYQVISWLHEIGFKQTEYANAFKEKCITGEVLLNGLSVNRMVSELGVDRSDALLIEKSIFILKNIKHKVIDCADDAVEETKQRETNNIGDVDGAFYKRKCEHLTRELKRMSRIEQMFKKNRRSTESKLKQLECNLYFGTLSEHHLMHKFDIDQLFEIQAAHNKTLMNIQDAIQSKVRTMRQDANQ